MVPLAEVNEFLVPSQAYLQPEQLDKTEAWYCPKCKDHVQVSFEFVAGNPAYFLTLHCNVLCNGALPTSVFFSQG